MSSTSNDNAQRAKQAGETGVSPVASLKEIKAVSAEQLAHAAQAGSTDAFAGLVQRFERSLFNFLNMRVGNPDDAEELTQETFLRAWQRIDRYDSRWMFSTWLFTLGKRLAASRFRKLSVRTASDDTLPEICSGEDPHGAAARSEQRINLWALASRVLSADQRSALWLRYAEELSMQEIARILAKRETTVRVLLFRAREKLAPCLAPEHGLAPSKPASATYNRINAAGSLAGGQR